MCTSTGRALHDQLVQTPQKSTQFAQHVRLIGEKDVVICPRHDNQPYATGGIRKVLVPPIDVGQGCIIEGIHRGAFLRVLRLVLWLRLIQSIVMGVLNAYVIAVQMF
jgi:hypothetical protein